MKQTLTLWKDRGHEALRGKTIELFKIFWDEHLSEWIRDESGTHWGVYKLNTKEIRRLTRAPEEMGDVFSVEDAEENQKETAPPLDPEDVYVDHLVAKDISITPEGLNLGEEK